MNGSTEKARKQHAHKYAYIVVLQRCIFPRNIYIVYNGFCIATKKRKVSLWSKTNKPLETMKAKLLFSKMLCMAHMYFPCQLAKIPPPSFTVQWS